MNRIQSVVIGGGTGAPTSIRTLLAMGFDTNAIVSMSDDGGSTGILRELGGAIPPGDIRKCIGAMSANYNGVFARTFRHRFEYLDNHSLGNLMLTACAEETGSFPDAIMAIERLLDARGHVIPSTLNSVYLSGMTDDGTKIEGEEAIGDAECHMRFVQLSPASARAYPPALNAIRESNFIVLGPGSLFTSIIPNLLVPGVVDAIRDAHNREDDPACTVFVCSIADMQGETWNMNCAEYVDALLRHGMRGLLDMVIIHKDADNSDSPFDSKTPSTLTDYSDSRTQTRGRKLGTVKYVKVNDDLLQSISDMGVEPLVRDIVDRHRPTWHNRKALAKAFEEVLVACHSQRRSRKS